MWASFYRKVVRFYTGATLIPLFAGSCFAGNPDLFLISPDNQAYMTSGTDAIMYHDLATTEDVVDLDCVGIPKKLTSVDPTFGKTWEFAHCSSLGVGLTDKMFGGGIFYGLRFNFK